MVMIISRTNMEVVSVTKHDKVPVLNNVHIQQDGTTIGSNGKVIMAVSPTKDFIRKTLGEQLGNDPLDEKGLTIDSDIIKDVLKNTPRDLHFRGVLEHCNVKPYDNSSVEFSMTDGKRPKIIKGQRWNRDYINYKEVFHAAYTSKKSVKVVLNLRRIISLLDAIDKACPDRTGNAPVFLEFSDSNDIILRSMNFMNGQRVFAVMQSYKGAEGEYIEETDWERSLCNVIPQQDKKPDVEVHDLVHRENNRNPCKIPKSQNDAKPERTKQQRRRKR